MVAEVLPTSPRAKTLIVFAAVAPDLDGLGIVAEVATRNTTHPLNWFSEYHHLLGHNIGFCMLVSAVCFLSSASGEAVKTAILAFISFHLHLLADLAGSRGPDGFQWPIPYLLPFSHVWTWQWSGQWSLNGWQNLAITLLLLTATFFLAWKRGYSPIRIFSSQAHAAFIDVIRQRFPVGIKRESAN